MSKHWIVVLFAFPLVFPVRADALLGECGQPRAGGPVATDALEILATAVGTSNCGGFDVCICDVNSAGGATATDALLVLGKAVGQNVVLVCPCATTTSTTTTTTLPGVVETTELVVMTRSEGSYATADLAGTWDVSTLGSGPSEPWWSRGTITAQSNGKFSGSITGSDGVVENPSGRLAVSASGIVTCPSGCLPGFQGALSSAKTVMVATNSFEDDSTEILVITRRGSSYSQSDLAGTWDLSEMSTGFATPSWSRGPLDIQANGNAAGTLDVSDGSTADLEATFVLSGTGRVTCSSGCEPDLRGALDSGKTVTAITYTATDGSTYLTVISKKAASYAPADLAGDWYVSALASGVDAPWWGRGTLTIETNGSFAGTITGSDGAPDNLTGDMAITSGGVVTIDGDPRFRCGMDAGKTVLACTNTR